MNNRNEQAKRPLGTPEDEQRKRKSLDQLNELADSTTADSLWIVDMVANQHSMTLTVNRNGSLANRPVIRLVVDIHPVFPHQLTKDRVAFVAERQAKLDDAIALIQDLNVINILNGAEWQT